VAAAGAAATAGGDDGLEYRLLGEAGDRGALDHPYGERGQTQRDRWISGGRC